MRLDSDDLLKLKSRVEEALGETKQQLERQRDSEAMLRMYEGRHWDQAAVEADPIRVMVNYSLSNVLIKVGALAYWEPDFLLEYRGQRQMNPVIVESLIKDAWNKRYLKQEARVLLDTKIFGLGVGYISWVTKGRQWYVPTGGRPAKEVEVISNGPRLRRVKPQNFGLEPDVWDLEEAAYCCEKVQVPYEEIVGNPHLKNTERLKQTYVLAGQPERGNFDLGPTTPGARREPRVDLYYYYELRNNLCVIFGDGQASATGLGEPIALYSGEMPLSYPGYPFAILENIPSPDSFWGLSDIGVSRNQAEELNETRTYMLNHMRRFNRMLQGPKGLLSPQMKDALRMAVDGTFLETEGPGEIRPVQDASAPREVYLNADWAKEDMQTITGVTAFAQGQPMKGINFATEAALVANKSDARGHLERSELGQFRQDVAERVLWALWEYGEEPVVLNVPDPITRAMTQQVVIPKDAIGDPKEWVLRVSDEAGKDVLASKRRMLLQMLAPYVQLGLVDPRPLIRSELIAAEVDDIEAVMAGVPVAAPQPPQPGGGSPSEGVANETGLPSRVAALVGGMAGVGGQQ